GFGLELTNVEDPIAIAVRLRIADQVEGVIDAVSVAVALSSDLGSPENQANGTEDERGNPSTIRRESQRPHLRAHRSPPVKCAPARTPADHTHESGEPDQVTPGSPLESRDLIEPSASDERRAYHEFLSAKMT